MDETHLREILHSLDQLLGLHGNFWALQTEKPVMLEQEQLAELSHELLTEVLGLRL